MVLKIPDANSSWEIIAEFALSFNGYHFVKGGPTELSLLYDKAALDPTSASLDELRACLFFLQRAARWNDNEGCGSDLEEANTLLDLMREKYEFRRNFK